MFLAVPNDDGLAGLFGRAWDEEAAHYRLMAYLQRIRSGYSERRLYPYVSDVSLRVRALRELVEQKRKLRNALGSPVIGFDLVEGRLHRAPLAEQPQVAAMDRLLSRTLPELEGLRRMGAELREEFTAHIQMEPVGLLPLHVSEGYLLLHQGHELRAYAYTVPVPLRCDELDGTDLVRTRYLNAYRPSLVFTYEQVKADLVRTFSHLPNPAVFAFTVDITLPALETFVPLAKRLVYEVIGATKPVA